MPLSLGLIYEWIHYSRLKHINVMVERGEKKERGEDERREKIRWRLATSDDDHA